MPEADIPVAGAFPAADPPAGAAPPDEVVPVAMLVDVALAASVGTGPVGFASASPGPSDSARRTVRPSLTSSPGTSGRAVCVDLLPVQERAVGGPEVADRRVRRGAVPQHDLEVVLRHLHVEDLDARGGAPAESVRAGDGEAVGLAGLLAVFDADAERHGQILPEGDSSPAPEAR